MLKDKKRKRTLIIFAKEPKPHRVKTRLSKDFPPLWVTNLYKAFLKDILKKARRVRCHERFIYHAGSLSLPFLKKFKKDFLYAAQRGRNLGERMSRAFERHQKHGYARTVIIGADCPMMSINYINRAFQKLDRYDMVLGPCPDGGYALVGLKDVSPALFKGIPWSSAHVLSKTLSVAKRLRKSVYLLEELEDIDHQESLKRLSRHKNLKKMARYTWNMMQRFSYEDAKATL